MQKAVAGTLALVAVLGASCTVHVHRNYYGDFVGERPPGVVPRLFAPGRISTDLAERDTAVAPNGNAIFYTVTGGSGATIVFVERLGGVWQQPYVAPFSGRHTDLEPFFEPGSNRLWFASTRPLPGEEAADDYNLWVVEYLDDGWGEPRPAIGLNGPGDEFYPSVTANGAVYFTTERAGGIGGEDIYRATRSPELGGGWHVEVLGPNVNTAGPEFNAFVNPDETLLLFSSVREGDLGGGDLYMCTREPGGVWSPARALPEPINSPRLDYCPFVTYDGRFLFFTSQRRDDLPDQVPWSWESLNQFERGPANGRDSIYWVDAGLLKTAYEAPPRAEGDAPALPPVVPAEATEAPAEEAPSGDGGDGPP